MQTDRERIEAALRILHGEGNQAELMPIWINGDIPVAAILLPDVDLVPIKKSAKGTTYGVAELISRKE